MKYIYYSCLLCKEEFNRMDEIEYHLREKHKITEQEEYDRSYLIHFPPHNKGVSI